MHPFLSAHAAFVRTTCGAAEPTTDACSPAVRHSEHGSPVSVTKAAFFWRCADASEHSFSSAFFAETITDVLVDDMLHQKPA